MKCYVGDNPYGISAINLTTDNGAPINDMLQEDAAFRRISPDGSLQNGMFYTDLGIGNPIQGIAYTQNHAIMAVDGGFLVYDKLAFQNHMDYAVPEPGTRLISIMLGSFLLRRKRVA